MRIDASVAVLILEIRGQRVMLDADLAALYRVSTKALVQAVKRNVDRFPSDFMFRLSEHELSNLRSQVVTSSPAGSKAWGGRRWLPYAFSERVAGHDKDIATIVRAIRELATPAAETPKRPIGFIR